MSRSVLQALRLMELFTPHNDFTSRDLISDRYHDFKNWRFLGLVNHK
ncbi:hypothetical protein UYSO10_0763 [Kosakonia radicincitans]|nr:hypothetical protein UYSO10_0763 [Kosakonia radicincitans]